MNLTYPTGWGWMTIAAGVTILVLLIWHPPAKGKKNVRRLLKIYVLILLIPWFLFAFMQWATWYK